jgi:hypothetical protein
MWEGLPMLLWQPQNSLRIRAVFFVSLALHILVCFSLLFVYKDYHQRLCIDLSSRIPSQAIVKLLPLSASRPSSQRLGTKEGKKGATTSQAVVRTPKKKKSPTSLVKQTTVSKSIKNQKSKKAAELKKAAAKALSEKKAKKAQQRLIEAEKQKKAEELQKKLEAEKNLEKEKKQVEEVKSPFAQASADSGPQRGSSKEEVKANEAAAVPVGDKSNSHENVRGALGPEGEEILYLTKQEFDALQIQQKLQECLFDVWTPPTGISSGTFCEVLITIGWDGVILETQFLKKSDILMYDLSVQETVEQVTFPHEVWGKQITITFKP